MTNRYSPFCAGSLIFLVLLLASALPASAKAPTEFRGVKLGMEKSEVRKVLETSPWHLSYNDMAGQLGEIIRGDKLFRYATYRFDAAGKLAEIALEMREIIGRDRCLELFNKEYGLDLSPGKRAVDGDLMIEVKGNQVILRRTSEQEARATGHVN